MPDVSIIIVNYNGRHLLEECLRSVFCQTFRSFEVIVADNASSDGSRSFLLGYPGIRPLLLDDNTGFAGANNRAFAVSGGDTVLLLNNDAVMHENCLSELVTDMEKHPETGICAAKMTRYGENVIDSAGDGYSRCLRGIKRGEGMPAMSFNHPEYVFGACAGAALYRRRMIDETGFFDEEFFLMHEDTDLNFRAQLAGWKIRFVPTAIVRHKVRSTIGAMSDTVIFYSLRNHELVRMKNVPAGLFIRCFPLFFLSEMIECIYVLVRRRRPGVYVRAKLSALRLVPSMLHKRARIMQGRKVGNAYLYGIMTPFFNRAFLADKLRRFFGV